VTINTQFRQGWAYTGRHFLLDVALWTAGFTVAACLRFFGGCEVILDTLQAGMVGILLAGLAMASVVYMGGLYGARVRQRPGKVRAACLAAGLLAGVAVILMVGSLYFPARMGRGVLGIGLLMVALLVGLHHLWMHLRLRGLRQKVAAVVSCAEDEAKVLLLEPLGERGEEIVGCLTAPGYRLRSKMRWLGGVGDIEVVVEELKLVKVYYSREGLRDHDVARQLRRARYRGLSMEPLVEACEELCQAVPLGMIDEGWLLEACGYPDHHYVARFKRSTDIAVALFLGVVLAPALLAGMVVVWISSGRPIFFSQTRVGRFHRSFQLHKLRTMRPDAEASGARWSGEGDPRVIRFGGILRKFRIDEIPQLWNILIGEMSFIGPRPEVPRFVDQLAREIRFYRERHLLRPGLTGWAQVCYPYGSSVDDARRKLEFDLYYLKHMGLQLDLFIFLDTCKVVFCGGASQRRGERLAEMEMIYEEALREMGGDGATGDGRQGEGEEIVLAPTG
jgi:exopolysaccharide biosynthesis polyprenyl glycosylphosphotransferase